MKKELRYAQEQSLLLEESCLPPLQSGKYELTLSQKTDAFGDGESIREVFLVDGPRFQLSQEDIDSVYPPSGITGSFGACLPQITFRRKTLLWERALEAEKRLRCHSDHNHGTPLKEKPWLALVCLQGEEILPIQTQKAADATVPPSHTFFPKLTLLDSEKEELCSYLDMDTALFQSVVPYPEELALLCHSRRVDRTNKQRRSNQEEDWVSVLAGNRLPASSETGSRNHIYLVSLEGFGDYTKISPTQFPQIRLLVLYHWEYISVTTPRTFLEYLKGLSHVSLHSQIPEEDPNFIPNGYYPMEHHFRNGAVTVSLYRGPLVPEIPEEKGLHGFSADELYRYLPEIGLFDISYAAAWQLGRLIALNSQAVAEKLMKVKQGNLQQALRRGQQAALLRHMIGSGASETLTQQLLQMLEEGEDSP